MRDAASGVCLGRASGVVVCIGALLLASGCTTASSVTGGARSSPQTSAGAPSTSAGAPSTSAGATPSRGTAPRPGGGRLTIPGERARPPVAPPGSALATRPVGWPPTPAGVRAAVVAALDDPDLGSRLGVAVLDPFTGHTLYGSDQDSAFLPASTQKLFTAVAAVETLGAARRLTTRVVRAGAPTAAGVVPLVLVGGGDVSLARDPVVPGHPVVPGATVGAADVATLAARTVGALAGARSVTLSVDPGLFTGPAANPYWSQTYITGGQVSPVSALSVDAGRVGPGRRVRSTSPAVAAGEALADRLRARGLTVTLSALPTRVRATAPTLAAVQSPPVAALVAHMLATSDNDYAEALFRLVAVASGRPGDFPGGTRAVLAALTRAGVDVRPLRLVDGSGLSRLDRATPSAEASALSVALRVPALRPVADGLGVAGVSGTVASGFTGPAAAGRLRVRAKTGSLPAVSALAGTISTAGSGELVFVFLSDTLPTTYPNGPRRALELAAARLAQCGCHLPGPAGPLR